MKKTTYKMKAEAWVYHMGSSSFAKATEGRGRWYFVNVSKKASKEIKEKFGKKRRGFGSIPVLVAVGKTSWKTSIFPDRKSGAYVLPLKAQAREKENIKNGKTITFSIEVRA